MLSGGETVLTGTVSDSPSVFVWLFKKQWETRHPENSKTPTGTNCLEHFINMHNYVILKSTIWNTMEVYSMTTHYCSCSLHDAARMRMCADPPSLQPLFYLMTLLGANLETWRGWQLLVAELEGLTLRGSGGSSTHKKSNRLMRCRKRVDGAGVTSAPGEGVIKK